MTKWQIAGMVAVIWLDVFGGLVALMQDVKMFDSEFMEDDTDGEV